MGVGGQRHAEADLPPWKTRYPFEAGWAPGLVWTGAKNLAPPPGFDPRAVQLVTSRYTDWAIPAHTRRIEHWNLLLVLSDWSPFFWQKGRSESVVWDLREPLLKVVEERRWSSGGEGGGDLFSTAVLEMLDFWLTRLSHGRSLLFAGLLATYWSQICGLSCYSRLHFLVFKQYLQRRRYLVFMVYLLFPKVLLITKTMDQTWIPPLTTCTRHVLQSAEARHCCNHRSTCPIDTFHICETIILIGCTIAVTADFMC